MATPRKPTRTSQLPDAAGSFSALGFAVLVGLLALAGMALSGPTFESPLGAAGAVEKATSLGEGFGIGCSGISSSSRSIEDCCSIMCRPYTGGVSHLPCLRSCTTTALGENDIADLGSMPFDDF